jgi:hypothetical protein
VHGCAARSGNTFYVDSVSGNDGNNATVDCPLASVHLALEWALLEGSSEAYVIVSGPIRPPTLSGPWSISIPAHVHVVGNGTNAPISDYGFVMGGDHSSLSNFIIDGHNTRDVGIMAVSGSAITTRIDHVTVRNMGDGIVVGNRGGSLTGGVLVIGPGVVVSDNGFFGASYSRRSGLVVADNGKAIITGSTTGLARDRIAFVRNAADGILVVDDGAVVIQGTASSTTSASVIANDNSGAGVHVEQWPGVVGASSITGLVAFGNHSSGIEVLAGSTLRVRESILIGNAGDGVLVSTFDLLSAPHVDDVSTIDLGRDALNDPGANTLQAPLGRGENGRAGLCLKLTPCAGSTLSAAGNVFRNVDCRSPGAARLTHSVDCNRSVDVAVIPGSTVDTGSCAQ